MKTKIKVSFMSLEGQFCTVKTEIFSNMVDVLKAVTDHCQAAGYSNVKTVDEDDVDSIRYTAKTPGGRGGRNVAFADFFYEES